MKRLYNKDKLSLWDTIVPLMKIAVQNCRCRMLAQCVLYIFHGMFMALVAYVTQWFFDSVNLTLSEGMILPVTYIALFAMVTCILLDHIINGWQNYNSEIIHIRLIGVYKNLLNRKAGKIAASNYESQVFLQTLEKAVRASTQEGAPFFVSCILNVLFCYVPYVITMSIYLYSLHPLLILTIFLVFIPLLIAQVIKIRMYDTLEDTTVQDRREYQYYESCIVGKELKETRTLGAYGFFKNLYSIVQNRLIQKEWNTRCRATKLDVLMKSVTLMGYLGVLVLLIVLVLQGSVSIGAFAAVFSSVSVMFEELQEMVDWQLGRMLSKTGLTSNLIYFLSLPERGGDNQHEGDNSGRIELDHVSFTYPGSQNAVLNDVNLSISNETVAIVGMNGAGKSTLIKLLTGIYTPDSGRVTINGLDTALSSVDALCSNTSGIFQNFQKYKMSLRDNVAISDMERDTTDGEMTDLLNQVNLKEQTEALPNGLDTMLSADFDGVELSGGQWQRLAIARGLHRKHGIIVLDEPTSAIDPIEEKYLYEQFANIAKGKTAVIVTHRMSSARIADRIVVMHDGTIVEEGTHERLMALGGRYAWMFKKQASWYQNDTTALHQEAERNR